MRYIKDIKDGYTVQDVYLCKTKNSATTKNGKEYLNVILADKTGNVLNVSASAIVMDFSLP